VAGLACRHDLAFVTLALRDRGALWAYLGWTCGLLPPMVYGCRLLYGRWLPPYVADHGTGSLGLVNLAAWRACCSAPTEGIWSTARCWP